MSRPRKCLIILLHAFVGWAICGAIMGIGMKVTTMRITLAAHAIGGPVAFAIISLVYHRKFGYTRPLFTASIFIGFVIFMDVFLVALLIEKNFEMFASAWGTWIPFAMVFVAVYLVGVAVGKQKRLTQE